MIRYMAKGHTSKGLQRSLIHCCGATGSSIKCFRGVKRGANRCLYLPPPVVRNQEHRLPVCDGLDRPLQPLGDVLESAAPRICGGSSVLTAEAWQRHRDAMVPVFQVSNLPC